MRYFLFVVVRLEFLSLKNAYFDGVHQVALEIKIRTDTVQRGTLLQNDFFDFS